uniref:NADH-ubiquinone oxidoreductase chain 1 n=1 Tax=Groenewaldozyma salmanticensis TaxID=49332 RepID=E5L081_9ASCO|nr:NADH dehydrogenase subunit 1 [Groenewaldozyma salmanticensis]ADO51046.1 NADH dehydrogenase subunit 1 [Groenewaldozyma salmanticensis]
MFLFFDIIELIIFLVMILFTVAYLTVLERKTMGYMQRRIGPNVVGWYGLLQAFADAVKLLIKEIVIPKSANKILFFIGPIIVLLTALLVWLSIPFGPLFTMGYSNYSILYILSIGSVGVFGGLFAGWSSNSKYSFMSSIRSTAQLISYELVLTTVYILVIMFINSLNFFFTVDIQTNAWLTLPLLPIMLIYYISTISETGRPPFDLLEAESELVAGHMTEYSAGPFVYFFLAEYSNLIFMSSTTILLFFGGYDYPFFFSDLIFNLLPNNLLITVSGILYTLSIMFKLCISMFIFIWVRASFPRFTYDNLINLCWVIFLPILFGYILFVPSILYFLNSFLII